MKGLTIEMCVSRFLPYSMSTGNCPPLSFAKLYLLFPLLWRLFGIEFLVINSKMGQDSQS